MMIAQSLEENLKPQTSNLKSQISKLTRFPIHICRTFIIFADRNLNYKFVT